MVFERIPNEASDASILGEPLTFRNGRIAPNRFLKASMTEKISTWDKDLTKRGIPSERIINMYEKWGNGGFGLILTGNVPVDPYYLESAGNIVVCRENDTPKLRKQLARLAKVMKADGALAIVQISHAGRQTPITVHGRPYSSSDVQLEAKALGAFGKPIPLTTEQIQKEVIDRFTYAAEVLHEAGFDGVQLHAAHGYLLSQFMSPTTNKRTDQYGGSPQNRVRIVMEIYDAIRQEIPVETGFIVGIKTNSVEFQDQGLESDDARIMCQMMEDKGFDFVEMSGGTYEKFVLFHTKESTKKREAFFLEFTDKLRSVFKNTKVYVTGGFRTAGGMAAAVQGGSTDGVGLGRPATAEPDLPKKILSGRASSAAASKIVPEVEFPLSIMSAGSQMALMGRRPLSEVNDICDDIPDFSVPEEAENFRQQAGAYFLEVMKIAENNLPLHGVLEYKALKTSA